MVDAHVTVATAGSTSAMINLKAIRAVAAVKAVIVARAGVIISLWATKVDVHVMAAIATSYNAT